jgi:serine/threonine protein kinase/Tol biopolymer transport system component
MMVGVVALSAGTRLGAYEVSTLLGAGGMGEVYRASDTSLGRQVAIKVLPDPVALDPESLARFDREARTLAALSHPNIGAIYGIERSGGITALVMELVEGPTLADYLQERRLPLGEAVRIAQQIAAALEAAHAQGIVHRDVKPSNVKVRPDGTVKVLDFGLAKALEPAVSATPPTSASTMSSPTLTRAGVILGTAAYMSPEQARGKQVDTRSDIWAFGCVLYEMLTGVRAFGGDDIQETLASVLAREPDWSRLPPDLPSDFRRILRRCLDKDPAKRLRDIGDARIDLGDALTPSDPISRSQPAARASGRATWIAGAAGLVLGLALTSLIAGSVPRPGSSASRPVLHLSMTFPASAPMRISGGFAVSPDGTRLVYVGSDGRLYFRPFDAEPRVLPGTEEATEPFFSPDGESIGFVAAPVGQGTVARLGQLKKISVRGGGPVVLGDAVALGGSWGRDGQIVYSRKTDQGVGLFAIAADGGEATPLVLPASGTGAVRYGQPHHLPDGDTVVFSATDRPSFNSGRIIARSMRTGNQHTVVEPGYAARVLSSGHLVYVLDGSLMVVRFDSGNLRSIGPPIRVIADIEVADVAGQASVSVSESGDLLLYASRDRGENERTLFWVTREGLETPILQERAAYSYPRLSPDGQHLAVGVGNDIWIIDLKRGTRNRIAETDRGSNPAPPIVAWTSDSRHITFSRRNPPEVTLELAAHDDIDRPTPILVKPYLIAPGSWSKDGVLALFQIPGATLRDLAVFAPGSTEPQPFLATRFNERGPMFSPDGKWIAYTADPTGRDEVYVRPYPGPGPPVTVSTDGGSEPAWARDGRALYYRSDNRLMSVPVEHGFLGQPRVVFERPYARSGLGVTGYDVGADGRFIMISQSPTYPGGQELTVIQHWFSELGRLLPAN